MARYALFIYLMVIISGLRADVAFFTNLSGDNNWHNPANWSTNRVPGMWDRVHIPEGKTCSFSGIGNVRSITIEGQLWALNGGRIFSEEFRVEKGGEVLLNKRLYLDGWGAPFTNLLNVRNEGTIQGVGKDAALSIGPPFHSPDSEKGTSLNNAGGQIKDLNLWFRGDNITLDGG